MVCLRFPTVVLQCFHLLPCWQAEKSKKPIRCGYCGSCERPQACHPGLMVVSGVCSPECCENLLPWRVTVSTSCHGRFVEQHTEGHRLSPIFGQQRLYWRGICMCFDAITPARMPNTEVM